MGKKTEERRKKEKRRSSMQGRREQKIKEGRQEGGRRHGEVAELPPATRSRGRDYEKRYCTGSQGGCSAQEYCNEQGEARLFLCRGNGEYL